MIKPIGNKLVVRRDPHTLPPDISDRFFSGRIIIPDTAKAKSRQGEVIHVGPGVKEPIRPGDRVLITWLDGTRYEDKDLGPIELFLESEILAIVTE